MNTSSWATCPMKRAVDLGAAALLLLLLCPLFLALGLLVRLRLGAPILFRQTRPGLHGRLFTLVKFRSLREGPGTDEQRMTPFGRRLRASGLDELPELLNILRGDMSFIGPRPLLPAYLDRYSPEQARRHLVRPGLTGWAQVHGRNALTWERKFELDTWYVDHASPLVDLRILTLTFLQLLRGSRENSPASEFTGS